MFLGKRAKSATNAHKRIWTKLWIFILLACTSSAHAKWSLRRFPLQNDDHETNIQVGKLFLGVRQYGNTYSNESIAAIETDRNGNIYLVGTIALLNSTARSCVDSVKTSSATSSATNIFLTKLNSDGEVIWTKIDGTACGDDVHAMTITSHAVYVCGSTEGLFGEVHSGGKDIFVQKYSHDGETGWEVPFQFGSEHDDICMSICAEYDSGSHEIFMSGSTTGDLFGRVNASSLEKDGILVKLTEKPSENGSLVVVKGRQRSTIRSDSADFLKLSKTHAYVVSNTYNEQGNLDSQASAYLFMYDRHVLKIHDMLPVRIDSNGGFFATDVLMDEQLGNLYIAGFAYYEAAHAATYGVAKYALNEMQGTGLRQVWNATMGIADPAALKLTHARLSLGLNTTRNELCVAGVVHGVYENHLNPFYGLLSSPWYFLNPDSGTVLGKQEMISHYPFGAHELTGIVHDIHKGYIFAGTVTNARDREDTVMPEENIFVGRFSPKWNSTDRTETVWTTLLQNHTADVNRSDTHFNKRHGTDNVHQETKLYVGFIILGASVAAIFIGAAAYTIIRKPWMSHGDDEYGSFVNDSASEIDVLWERIPNSGRTDADNLEEIVLNTPRGASRQKHAL